MNPALMLLMRGPAAAGGALTPSLVYFGTTGSDSTNYTWSSVALGAESANRTIVVLSLSAAGSPGTVSGVTIDTGGGAQAMTVDSTGSGANVSWGAARLAVPTGSTATVVVSHTAANVRSSIAVYAIPAAIAPNAGNFSSTGTVTVAGADNGVVLAGHIGEFADNTLSAGATADCDLTLFPDSASFRFQYGSAALDSTGDVTVSVAGSGTRRVGAITYDPA